MFSKVNNTTYMLSPEESSRITAIASATVGGLTTPEVPVNPNTRTTDIRNILSVLVGGLVCNNLRDELETNGFLCIRVCGDYPVDISVGLVDGELAYGVLIK